MISKFSEMLMRDSALRDSIVSRVAYSSVMN